MYNYNREVRYDLSEISAKLDIMKASIFLLALGFMYFAYFVCQIKPHFNFEIRTLL
jgi:hypothetical protein